MKSILDPTFRYVPSIETDLRKTFARVRHELRTNAPRSAPAPGNHSQNVLSMHGGAGRALQNGDWKSPHS